MKSIFRQKYLSNLTLLVALILSLQSCFVAKDYTRPDLSETKSLYRTDNLPTDSSSIADLSWKTLFKDQELQNHIDEALENNMDIRIAIQQIIAAEAYAKQGKAGYQPIVGIGVNASHQEYSKNSQFGSIFKTGLDSYDITANLSWEADVWGKIRSQKRSTRAAYLKSIAGHQAVKTKLVSSIATTYYTLLALDAQLQVTNKTIETRENSLAVIKSLKDAGQVSQVAVDQLIAQYNNAKALKVDIEIAIYKTENTLSILKGISPQSIKRTELSIQKFEEEIKLGIPSMLLRNRPDVMSAEYNLIQSFEQTNIARSNLYPTLKLTASGGFQSLELDRLLSVKSLFASIIGGVAQPLLNQRKLKTEKEAAISKQEQALLAFKKTLLIAGSEVSNALFTYEAQTRKIEFRTNEVEALRTAELNSEELLKNGYANYLDLLTARQSALSAELNTIDTKLQQLTSVVNLYEALGGGWK